jgi:hypothetical protein
LAVLGEAECHDGSSTPPPAVTTTPTGPGVVPGQTTTPGGPGVVPGETTPAGPGVPGETATPVVPGVVPGESSVPCPESTAPAGTIPGGPDTGLPSGGASGSVPGSPAYTHGPSLTVGRPSQTGAFTRVTPSFTNVVTACNAACHASKTSAGLVAHTSPASGGNGSGPHPNPHPTTIPFNAAGRATLSGFAVIFGALCAIAIQI